MTLTNDEKMTLAENVANVARLILSTAWTLIWGTARWWWYSLCSALELQFAPIWGFNRTVAFAWGRRDSPKPVICVCGWVGPMRWLIHTYADDGCGDVEPVDECPRCGRTDQYEGVFKRKNGSWAS